MSGLLVVRAAGSVAWPPATVDGRPTPALHEDDLPSTPASRTVAAEVSSRALCYRGCSRARAARAIRTRGAAGSGRRWIDRRRPTGRGRGRLARRRCSSGQRARRTRLPARECRPRRRWPPQTPPPWTRSRWAARTADQGVVSHRSAASLYGLGQPPGRPSRVHGATSQANPTTRRSHPCPAARRRRVGQPERPPGHPTFAYRLGPAGGPRGSRGGGPSDRRWHPSY